MSAIPHTPLRLSFGFELLDAACRLGIHQDEREGELDAVRPGLDQVARLARTAERGCLDFFIVDDNLAGAPPLRGRRRSAVGPLRLASRLAPVTGEIAVVPRVRSSSIEPGSLLDGLVALDLASAGRLAWQLDLPTKGVSAGRGADLLTAIVDDAWSDQAPQSQMGAMARADRDRRIRQGQSAGGRSDDPRTGQHSALAPPCQPHLMMSGDCGPALSLAVRRADVVRISAADAAAAAQRRAEIRSLTAAAGRDPNSIRVLVDLSICLGFEPSHALARRGIVEEMIGMSLGGASAIWVGEPAGLADMICDWIAAGACDGFTFLPTSLPADLLFMVDAVIPILQARGLARRATAEPARSGRATVGRSPSVRSTVGGSAANGSAASRTAVPTTAGLPRIPVASRLARTAGAGRGAGVAQTGGPVPAALPTARPRRRTAGPRAAVPA